LVSFSSGAAYWYNTIPNTNYEETLLAVKAESVARDIPFQSILIDSWFYPKGVNGGVKNWTAMPDIFPHGLAALQQQLEWQIVAHNRWWSNSTDYAKRNGGAFEFIIDDEQASALPQDDAFCQCKGREREIANKCVWLVCASISSVWHSVLLACACA
jgi:hypothetical protein